MDPTIHQSLNDRGECHIGGKWMKCTPQPRRDAIRSLINAESWIPKPSDLRDAHENGGERVFDQVPQQFSDSRFEMYTRVRSGVMDAYRRRFRELNPRLYAA